ncbi:MAG: CNNM domain-containing protein [Planctomycetota bacterium]|nr:CNNM domain-containing protein [Planctomycetota bacterium]
MTIYLIPILLFVLGYALSFFFSGFETGGYSLSSIRFELRKADNYRGAHLLAEDLSDMNGVIATTLVGTNLGNYMLTAAVVGLLQALDPKTIEIVSTVLLTPFVFVFAEVLPKALFRRHADEIMYRAARLFRLSRGFFFPVTYLLSFVPVFLKIIGLNRQDGNTFNPSTLERFSIELARGTEEGVLSANQATMARRIMSLGSRTVKHAMVPILQVVKWDQKIALKQAKKRMAQIPYSRVPIYDGTPSNFVGTVWIYDVFFGDKRELREYTQATPRLRDNTSIDVALLQLRNKHEPMAFVVDEKDKVIGIVTLKDLVTEIVTDLHDL